jgi:tetratricopeptide (TPR) repeat protein
MEQMRQLLLVVAVVSVAVPALASDEQDCFQGQQPQQRIEGCSALISRAPNDATVYHNRAVAYGLAGDIDSAIADYSKAIEIEPSNASAYDNRGRAYAMKGEHDRATQDQAKAEELMAKAIGQPNSSMPKTTGALGEPKPAKSQPKPKAKATKPAAKEEPASGLGWLFTPWGSNADQATPKNDKP